MVSSTSRGAAAALFWISSRRIVLFGVLRTFAAPGVTAFSRGVPDAGDAILRRVITALLKLDHKLGDALPVWRRRRMLRRNIVDV